MIRYIITFAAFVVIAIVSLAGFRGDLARKPPIEIFPDMDRQPKLRPQEPNRFFASKMSSQSPLEGTVARSARVSGANLVQVLPFEDHPINTGRSVGSTNFVDNIPLAVTAALLERGRERFSITCSPCHGEQGDGKGIVSLYGWPIIANLHDPRIVALPDGEIYYTLSYGKSTMTGYAEKITIADRWAIVAYVRALQLSRLGAIDDVPADQRDSLDALEE